MTEQTKKLSKIIRELIVRNFNAYPVRSSILMILMLMSAMAEGLGVVGMVPLLTYMSNGSVGTNPINEFYEEIFTFLGVEMGIASLLALICISIIFKNIMRATTIIVSSFSAITIAKDLRHKLLSRVMTVRWSFITRTPIGTLTNALSTEAERSGNTYFSTFNFLTEVIFVVVFIFGSLFVDWRVTLMACAVGFLYAVVFHRMIVKTQNAGRKTTELFKSLVTRFTESLQGLKMLRAMSKHKEFLDIMGSEAKDIEISARQVVVANVVLKSTSEPIIATIIGFAVYFMVVNLGVELSEILVLIMLFGRLTTRITSVQRAAQGMAINESAYFSIHNVLENMDEEKEVMTAGLALDLQSCVSLENISFSYDSKTVLKDINLTIPVGSISALIGPSGGGKSTICDLILGFLEPNEGRVMCDIHDLRDIDLDHWRTEIGYVPQEVFLFHASIRKNITLGAEGISDEQVYKVLEMAGAREFVEEQGQGLDTVVGERGLKISGGQRQRLCLARALLMQPKLLILDEPTTALDKKTEVAIFETLEALKTDRAILVISHQDGIAKAADRIYEVKDGFVNLQR